MKKGDMVTVVTCSICPVLQGRAAKVKEVDEQGKMARLSFGKGRLNKNSPEWHNISDLIMGQQSTPPANEVGALTEEK